MNNSSIFADRVRQLREQKSISQPALGEALGLSKQSINDIEHSRNKTTLDKAILLAQYFNVSIDYLCGLTDNPEINK